MGQYHYLINLDKRQVVHPHEIGNGLKLHEQIGWPYATATALVMLLAASSSGGGRGGGDFRALHPLVGAWAGDRIAFIGDYATVDDVPGCNAAKIFELCSAACHACEPGDEPKGWESWTNISAKVREMMAAEFGIRYEGEGWLNIIEPRGKMAPAPQAPDLVIVGS